MKKLLLISALFATSAIAQEPIKVRVSECDSYEILLITKVGPDSESTLLQYCSRNEFQEKLNYLQSKPEFVVGNRKVRMTAIPLTD